MLMRQKSTICLLALLWLSGCATLHLDGRQASVPIWVTEGETTSRTNALNTPLTPPLEEVWSFNAGAGFGRVSPLIVDDVALVATRKGEVHAIELDSGNRLGQTEFGESIEGTPVVEDGILYVPVSWGGAGVQAYNLSRGSILWKAGEIPVAAGLVSDPDAVYAADVEGGVTAYEVATGEELWHVALGDRVGVKAAPLLVDGLLIVADDTGYVTALNAQDGSEVWQVDVGAPVHSSPSASRQAVFVPTTRGRLLALLQSDGAVQWKLQLPSAEVYLTPAAVDGEQVVFGGSDGVVRSVRAADGSVLWTTHVDAAITAAPLITANTIYVGTMASKLIALARADGTMSWETEVDGRIKSNFAAKGTQLIVLAEPRRVHLFEMSEEGYAVRDN